MGGRGSADRERARGGRQTQPRAAGVQSFARGGGAAAAEGRATHG